MSGVVHIVQVVHYELNLVFMSNSRSKSLELHFLDTLSFAIAD